METKTLRMIQGFSKFCLVISKILFIFSMVGLIGSLIGLAAYKTGLFVGTEGVQVGYVTIHNFIEGSALIGEGTLVAYMSTVMILCIGQGMVAKCGIRYFKQELADGTPFTFTGARTLLRYGIMVAVVPLASVMAADVTYNVINEMYDVVADMHLDNYASPEVGLVIILVSLLCRYGAEVMQRQNA